MFGQKGYIIGISGVNELEEAIIKAQEFKPVKYEKKKMETKKCYQLFKILLKNIRCKISGRRGNKCSKIIKKLLNRGYR